MDVLANQRREGRGRGAVAIVAAALAAGPAVARGSLPTATGTAIPLADPQYSLWIPSNYVSRGGVADLMVFYHGDPATVRNNLAYSNLNTILVTVNLGGFSSSYQTPYTNDTALFGKVVDEARTILRNRAEFDDNLTFDKVGLATFSAGWAAAREILKQTSNYNMISSYAAMDTIYASFTSSTDHTPLASQMVNFKKFALDAKNGAKTMVLNHTKVLTGTYANTEECADDINSYLGLTPASYTTPGLGNATHDMSFYRGIYSGNYTMYGMTGADANAHSVNLQESGQFLAEMPYNAKDVALGNGTTITTDVAVPIGMNYTGTTTGATFSGWVQLPRRGGDHVFNIANGSAATDLTISGVLWGIGPTMVMSGAGTITLSGASANTFSGLTRPNLGVLQLNKTAGVNAIAGNIDIHTGGTVRWLQSNQVKDTASLTVNGVPSTADLNGQSETVDSLWMYAGTTALGSGSLTIANAITANSTTSTAFITGSGVITAASLNAQGNLTRSGGGVTKLTGTGLTIGATRRLDLTNTKLITKASLATVTSLIQTGRNGGAWNGSGGIVTSMTDAQGNGALTTLAVALAGDIAKTSLGGVSVSPSDVLVMYTYAGDSTLDGKINGDDYFRIDNGFTGHLAGYENGDFNYDGRIDADDYFVIDRNYSRQGSPFSAGPLPEGVTAVPEAGVGALMLLLMLGRRGRTRRRTARVGAARSTASL